MSSYKEEITINNQAKDEGKKMEEIEAGEIDDDDAYEREAEEQERRSREKIYGGYDLEYDDNNDRETEEETRCKAEIARGIQMRKKFTYSDLEQNMYEVPLEPLDLSGKLSDYLVPVNKKRKNNNGAGKRIENRIEKDEVFPTASEMDNGKSMNTLTIGKVYRITFAEKKFANYRGEKRQVAQLTLESNPTIPPVEKRVIRATTTVTASLFKEHNYAQDCKTNKFYIVYKGERESKSSKNKYFDFAISTVPY